MKSKTDNHRPPITADQSEEEGIYSRWSRRKSQLAEQSATPAVDIEYPLSTPAAEPEPEELEKPPLPDVTTLDEDSDYSGFLSPEVDEKLRKFALRKLFHLPKFNIRDGLDDYDEDFRNFEPLGDIVTADMRFQQERQARLEAERLAQQRERELTLEAESTAEEQESPTEDAVATAEDGGGAEPQLVDPPDESGIVSQRPDKNTGDDSPESV
jgi:hypothetical protein